MRCFNMLTPTSVYSHKCSDVLWVFKKYFYYSPLFIKFVTFENLTLTRKTFFSWRIIVLIIVHISIEMCVKIRVALIEAFI